MERALSRFLELAELCDELAFEALEAIPPGDKKNPLLHAHSALMARALTDLRASCQLAVMGYTMQSWSVAASCFEAAHSIGFIGVDTDRALRWINHSERERGPWSAKDAVQNALIFLELERDARKRQEMVDREYALYATLCIAKHVNPVAEKYRYFYRRNQALLLRFSPVSTGRRIREAKKGLLVAIRSVTTGIWALLNAHHGDNEYLRQRLLKLMRSTDALLPDLIAVGGEATDTEPTGA